MPLTQGQLQKANHKMFSLMQQYNFDRTIVIRKFRKWIKKKGYDSIHNTLKTFDLIQILTNTSDEDFDRLEITDTMESYPSHRKDRDLSKANKETK